MRCQCLEIQNREVAGCEPCRPENPDPEVPGGARDPEVPGGANDPMRDDVDGDEAMVPKGASDYASSFLTAFIKSLGFKRILVRSDNERSLLSLLERVTCNLTGVELVLMTSPEGNHQANGFAEVGVREIKAQTILRSQLEQRFGNPIDDKDPLISWIPRHAANCVSRYRIMDDGERLVSVDVERLGNFQWWSLVSQCTSDHSVRTMHCEEETRGCRAVSTWDITRDLVLRFSSRQMV